MNKENIEYSIQLMQNAKNLNMGYYQSGEKKVNNIELLHSCGNTACFAGYIAISDKFKNDGGTKYRNGSPEYDNKWGAEAISVWLDISFNLACSLVTGACGFGLFSPFYNKEFTDVTPEDVIEKLELILDGSLT